MSRKTGKEGKDPRGVEGIPQDKEQDIDSSEAGVYESQYGGNSYEAAMDHFDPLSESEFVLGEPMAEYRSEYADGRAWAMSGGTYSHAKIASNLSRVLGNKLEGKDCEEVCGDVLIFVESCRSYRYPDLFVVCGEPKFEWEGEQAVTNPVLVVEVLSKSTEFIDRNDKFFEYFSIPSVREYLLVSQEDFHVESFQKIGQGEWKMCAYRGLESELYLASLDISLDMRVVYHATSLLRSKRKAGLASEKKSTE